MTQIPIEQAAAALRAAAVPCVLTGAGVSKESGVPTFRDAQTGLWAQYDPQQLATPEAFQRTPERVWGWYAYRRRIIAGVNPNPGHHALAQLEAELGALPVITQNVDDLHERAGSTDVIHLHGNIAANRCDHDCQGHPTPVHLSDEAAQSDDGPPVCPHCGRRSVRPAVIWFGEMLPQQAINRAAKLSEACDVMLVIGTSGLVTPAATLPQIAKQTRATIIEVNPDETPLSRYADVKLAEPSGEILPRVVEALAGA